VALAWMFTAGPPIVRLADTMRDAGFARSDNSW